MNLKAAEEVQRRLASLVEERPLGPVRSVAALDAAYRGRYAYGAAVLYAGGRLLERACSITLAAMPYVPGFLAFRELTPMLRAYLKLSGRPDVVLVDGHGVAHPRRCGIACHIGVTLRVPTVGVAKSRLYGVEAGDRLLDPEGREIGAVVRCGARRYYVSVGNYVTLRDAVALVSGLCVGGRIAPLHEAHLAAAAARRIEPGQLDGWGEAPCYITT